MTGVWRALCFPSVMAADLRVGFAQNGFEWDASAHVSATGSLAESIRSTNAPAISISNLIDLVVWAGMPSEQGKEISDFPSGQLTRVGAHNDYRTALSAWASELLGRRLRLGLRVDLRIRRYLDSSAVDASAAAVLRRSIRSFRRSVQSLIAADFRPEDFDRSETIVRVALDTWAHLETEVSELTAFRRDLWMHPTEFTSQRTAESQQLKARIDEALDQVFGRSEGRRVIAYHGFYFFTPQQWSLFQLLRAHPDVDQVFIVHDDGEGREYETWRRFFLERWNMPPLEYPAGRQPTQGAAALRSALEGRRVDPALLNGKVQLVGYRNPTEFARSWAEDRARSAAIGSDPTRLFAADAGEVDRIVRRLDAGSSDGPVDLADLPVGRFLLALHACVEVVPPAGYRLVLSDDRLIDMAASGFLDAGRSSLDPSECVPAFRRAMPFFDGCQEISEWEERAVSLERLVIDEVASLGARDSALSDADRMEFAVGNPLRLVPWCDISDSDARTLLLAVRKIREIAERVVAIEAQTPDRYLGWIRSQLQRGMQNLSQSDR